MTEPWIAARIEILAGPGSTEVVEVRRILVRPGSALAAMVDGGALGVTESFLADGALANDWKPYPAT